MDCVAKSTLLWNVASLCIPPHSIIYFASIHTSYYSRRSYSFVCISHYPIIIIMQTIWKNGTSYSLISYTLSSVSILFIIFHAIYEGVRIQLRNFSCDDCENVWNLFHYCHQIGCLNYLSLFRVRSWHNGMRSLIRWFLRKLLHILM